MRINAITTTSLLSVLLLSSLGLYNYSKYQESEDTLLDKVAISDKLDIEIDSKKAELEEVSIVLADTHNKVTDKESKLDSSSKNVKSLSSKVKELDASINEETSRIAHDKSEREERERIEAEKAEAERIKKESEAVAVAYSEPQVQASSPSSNSSSSGYTYESFLRDGIINWGGYKFSYYSQSVLQGGGLSIPGRHVSGGFVRDGDGYIVVANSAAKGTIIPTPFGDAKVYDRGTYGNHIDVYVA